LKHFCALRLYYVAVQECIFIGSCSVVEFDVRAF
jgi:hypothetical protein